MIQPHLWPQIEFFSSGGQEPQRLCMIQQQPFTWEEKYEQPRQHIIKQRHYLLKNVCLVKAMVFPLVMYGCESWTTKS